MPNPTLDSATITQRGALVKDDNGVSVGYKFVNITSKTTTTVKTGAGFFGALVINKVGSTDTLVVYDNTAASGTIIASITLQANIPAYIYNVAFGTGLTVVSGGGTAGDYTVTYV